MKVSTMLWPGPAILPLAEHEARHETGDARVDVDHGSAGEVEDLEPALEHALRVDVDRAHEPVRPQTQWATGA